MKLAWINASHQLTHLSPAMLLSIYRFYVTTILQEQLLELCLHIGRNGYFYLHLGALNW